jgi:hypothetical protein
MSLALHRQGRFVCWGVRLDFRSEAENDILPVEWFIQIYRITFAASEIHSRPWRDGCVVWPTGDPTLN